MAPADSARKTIRHWFEVALETVEPRRAVASSLALHDDTLNVDGQAIRLVPEGRIIVLAIGKAAGGMARGALDVLGDRIDRGIILTKYGHISEPIVGFEAFEANHPTPDQSGLDATARILEAVNGLAEPDVVIALISGGGSALLELPRDGVSLEDMQDVTRVLMHRGAGIHDLNTVRRALSQVKGGGLRRQIGPARCVTLLLSDVLGNDPATIASGPTVQADNTSGDALDVLDRFEIRGHAPAGVLSALGDDGEGDPVDTSRDVVAVIADNDTFVTAIANQAQLDGLRVQLLDDPYEGDAAELGREMVSLARTAPPDVDVLMRGGEATVEVRGDGTGGRNTEMALAAAIALEGNLQWCVASLASDGDDGNSGATGAVAEGDSVRRARGAGLEPVDALRRNDSATVFREVGGLIETGPTGTNVNDVYIALRMGAVGKEEDQE
jgi:glycerate 2-kinase